MFSFTFCLYFCVRQTESKSLGEKESKCSHVGAYLWRSDDNSGKCSLLRLRNLGVELRVVRFSGKDSNSLSLFTDPE